MKMKIYFHDNCFDGLASAAVFANFYRNGIRRDVEFIYEGLAHSADHAFSEVKYDGDENAIVDFKYSSDERLTWWFDHHQSAFLNREDELQFRAETSGKKFHDPTYRSCTKFIVDVAAEKFGFDSVRLKELIHWADIIDGAKFQSAQQAVELREPALKLMTVIEGVSNTKQLHNLIRAFQEITLDEILEQEWVQAAFHPLYERHLQSIDIIEKSAECSDGTIFFDVSHHTREGYNKFIPYRLFPQAVYCVGVSLSNHRAKVSVGSNPWSSRPRNQNLAALCEQYGGGGHAVVGAISFAPEDLPRAKAIAKKITQYLRDESS